MKLKELISWYSTLTPESIACLSEIYHEQAVFRDPFNKLHGQKQIVALFEHMFATTDDPVFHIIESQAAGGIAWVSWLFSFRLHGKTIRIEGVTRLDFGLDGRVRLHRDYWDSTDLFLEFPLLGTILRQVKKKMRLPQRQIV